jgi:hypothetical protein
MIDYVSVLFVAAVMRQVIIDWDWIGNRFTGLLRLGTTSNYNSFTGLYT